MAANKKQMFLSYDNSIMGSTVTASSRVWSSAGSLQMTFIHPLSLNFWAIVTSNGSPYATGPLSCLSVCNVGALWPNVWMYQDATRYGCRPRSRWDCVRWETQLPPKKEHSPHFSTHVYCGQTVASLSNRLSNCWAVVH